MLQFDHNGNPLGRTHVLHKETRFDEGVIPSWITPEGPTAGQPSEGATYEVQSAVEGGLLMSVPGINARRAVVTGPEIDLTQYKVVKLSARVFLQSEDPVSDLYGIFVLRLSDDLLTRGAGVGGFNNGASSRCAIQALDSTGTARYVQSYLPELRKGRYYDYSLFIDCEELTVYSGFGNQPQDVWIAGDKLGLGLVKPRIQMNTHGPVKSALLHRVSLDLWT